MGSDPSHDSRPVNERTVGPPEHSTGTSDITNQSQHDTDLRRAGMSMFCDPRVNSNICLLTYHVGPRGIGQMRQVLK